MRAVPVAFLLVALLSVTTVASTLSSGPGWQPTREPRPPIMIYGDEGFVRPNSGVRSGTGSATDPYIIADWSIDFDHPLALFSGSVGIDIRDTTAHFVVRNSEVVLSGTEPERPVTLINVANAAFEDFDAIGGDGAGFSVRSSEDVRLTRIHIEDAENAGLVVTESQRVVLRDFTISTTGSTGLQLSEVDDLVVVNASIETRPSVDAVNLQDFSNVTLESLAVAFRPDSSANQASGFWASGGSGLRLRNTSVDGTAGTGVTVQGAQDVEVANTSVLDAASEGFRFIGVDGLLVVGSSASLSGQAGFNVARSPNAVLAGLVALTNGEEGLLLQDSEASLVAGGNFSRNGAEGIYVAMSDGGRIVGVVANENGGRAGIYVRGANITVTNSVATGNKGHGIHFDVEGGEVSYNQLEGNERAGLALGSTDNIVGNNTGRIERFGEAAIPAPSATAALAAVVGAAAWTLRRRGSNCARRAGAAACAPPGSPRRRARAARRGSGPGRRSP